MKLRRNTVYLATLIVLAVLAALFVQMPQCGRIIYPYRYRQYIETFALEYDVDPMLIAAIIRVESKFHLDAVSSKGAIGLMQIMPETADWIALQLKVSDFNTEMLHDPELNIRFGTWYVSSLAREFDGRLEVVIASYNGGRGMVKGWLENGTWSGLYSDRDDIPFIETRNFLHSVFVTYQRYRQLY